MHTNKDDTNSQTKKNKNNDDDDDDDAVLISASDCTTKNNQVTTVVVVPVQPYEMCTMEECQYRVRTNEISMFERRTTTTTIFTTEERCSNRCSAIQHNTSNNNTTGTPSATPTATTTTQQYDPCKMITKYRRSVMSYNNNNNNNVIRSISALYTTIRYLIHHIYIPTLIETVTVGVIPTTTTRIAISYRSKLEFMDDRIRAVQVDIVKSQSSQSSSSIIQSSQLLQHQQLSIQYNITKYYLLTLYTMTMSSTVASSSSSSSVSVNHSGSSNSNSNSTTGSSDYVPTFAHRALQTSLQTYWNTATTTYMAHQHQQQQQQHACCESTTTTTTANNNTPTTMDCSDNGRPPPPKVSMMNRMMMDDEMMSYFLLVQFNQQLQLRIQQQQQEHPDTAEYTLFWYNYTELYRKVTSAAAALYNRTSDHGCQPPPPLRQPFTQYALDIIYHCIHGHYQTALRLIMKVPPSSSSSSSSHNDSSSDTNQTTTLPTKSRRCHGADEWHSPQYSIGDWNRFYILLKCTLATSIRYIRYQIMVRINSSAMKQEAYPLVEVARLLCYHDHHHDSDQHHRHGIDTTTATTTTNGSKIDPSILQPPPYSQHQRWHSLQECYDFCQSLELSMIHLNEKSITPIINNSNNMDCDPNVILQNVRIVFKINAIPSYDTIFLTTTTEAARTTMHQLVRTTDMDHSIGLYNNEAAVATAIKATTSHEDDTTSKTRSCLDTATARQRQQPSTTTTTTTTTTTYRSPDGFVVQTPEWFYSHHLFL